MRTKSDYLYTICLLLNIFFDSCQNVFGPHNKEGNDIVHEKKIELEPIQTALQSFFSASENKSKLLFGDSLFSISEYNNLYASKNYEPIWLQDDGLPAYTIQMLQAVQALHYDGIDTSNYAIASLQSQFQFLNTSDYDSLAYFDMALTHTYFKALHDVLIGSAFESKTNKEWKNKNDTAFVPSQLLASALETYQFGPLLDSLKPQHPWYKIFRNEYAKLDTANNSIRIEKSMIDIQDSVKDGYSAPWIQQLRKKLFVENNIQIDTTRMLWDSEISETIKTIQAKNLLKQTGKLDSLTWYRLHESSETKKEKLALNMERFRWLKQTWKEPYIWINIPHMELKYYDQDSIQFAMRTVVGRTSRPTPTLEAALENIVLSPPWTVPPTIMEQEIVPGIARKGGRYLARRGLKAYDRRGRIVDASRINAKNYKSFSIGQAPGYRSSLGEVKFNLPNPWAIYLHDTPHREDFVKTYRAYSSGCIRVHKPKEFATFLLNDSVKYSYQKIDSICKLRKTIFIPIKKDIEVFIVYLTTTVDSSGQVIYIKDIYNWDKPDLEALKSGVKTSRKM
ncbi:MAG: L,D-transpeptidase family protein [Chitinophagaceae bacterium]